MTQHEPIPFLDLKTPHRDLESELLEVMRSALSSASFIGGPAVVEFENEFASFCGTRYCVGVGSGTDALRFAIMAAGIGAGDAVITVPNTFIATTEAISQAGAVPEFVDIDKRTYNMSCEALREFLETQCTLDEKSGRLVSRRSRKRVAGIIPVHLYGQMADMDSILELADRYGLIVIEDACQAHGAEYFSKAQNRWCKAGSMGRAAAFSFYPGKNLGACGEAGAVTTNDADLAKTIEMLRDHGQKHKYYHEVEGYNGRLDAMQAGTLTVKLKYLSKWNEGRRSRAETYRLLLSECNDVLLPHEPDWSKSAYHLYVINVPDRERLQGFLSNANIGTGIHYPIPLHLQNAYKFLGYRKGDYPTAEGAASRILSLPMFPHLSDAMQMQVAEAISQCLSESAKCSI